MFLFFVSERYIMSYTALYRRLRPENFDEIVGQKAIVETIKNQILNDRISHAYLFTGTRGTGKTSTARIFAKAINCENNVDGNPCGKCKSCIDIASDHSINIIEIDAASNNGVDNIRQINDEVRYTPTLGKYKVYIIDEVHMLSGGAFNALLKTLEEPPSHVKFILATTEPHKIPATILSRCQRYDFKRISTNDIFESLKAYCELENVAVEDDAVFYIAKSATGSMRDALSLLDQVLAIFSNEKLSLQKVLDLIGGANSEDLFSIAKYMMAGDVYSSLKIIDKVFKDGVELKSFVGSLIETFRNILIAKIDDGSDSIIDLSTDGLAKIKIMAEGSSVEVLTYIVNELSYLQRELKLSVNTRTLVEVGIIKICKFESGDRNIALEAKINAIEDRLKKGEFRLSSSSSVGEKKEDKKKEPKHRVLVKSAPEDILRVVEHFDDLIEATEKMDKYFLKMAKPINLGDDRLLIYCYEEVAKNHLSSEKSINLLKNILKNRYNKDFNLKIIGSSEYNKLVDTTLSKEESDQSADEVYMQLKDLINFKIEKAGN